MQRRSSITSEPSAKKRESIAGHQPSGSPVTSAGATACKPKLISIVAPFYNEGEVIESFFSTIRSALYEIPNMRFEVICVDDGSSDDTLTKLIALVQRDRRFGVIELSRNFGKEAALTAGLDAARGDAVIPLDADLQDPPELIPELIAAWQRGADVVVARRRCRDSDTYLKRNTARLFYRLHNKLAKMQMPVDVGDFRLMDRSVVEALKRLPERQRFMKGLFAWVGFKTASVDYRRDQRNAGATKFSWFSLLNLAVEGLTSFSIAPLRFCAYAGTFTATMTLLYAGYILMRTLVRGIDVPGYASLLVAILFFGSLQLIGMGLLGEYVGRIYMETKQRPVYLVRSFHQAAMEDEAKSCTTVADHPLDHIRTL